VICIPVRPSGQVGSVMAFREGKPDARRLVIEAARFPPLMPIAA
jgi:hypothetical protein